MNERENRGGSVYRSGLYFFPLDACARRLLSVGKYDVFILFRRQ